jgi:hypothetical protein
MPPRVYSLRRLETLWFSCGRDARGPPEVVGNPEVVDSKVAVPQKYQSWGGKQWSALAGF